MQIWWFFLTVYVNKKELSPKIVFVVPLSMAGMTRRKWTIFCHVCQLTVTDYVGFCEEKGPIAICRRHRWTEWKVDDAVICERLFCERAVHTTEDQDGHKRKRFFVSGRHTQKTDDWNPVLRYVLLEDTIRDTTTNNWIISICSFAYAVNTT